MLNSSNHHQSEREWQYKIPWMDDCGSMNEMEGVVNIRGRQHQRCKWRWREKWQSMQFFLLTLRVISRCIILVYVANTVQIQNQFNYTEVSYTFWHCCLPIDICCTHNSQVSTWLQYREQEAVYFSFRMNRLTDRLIGQILIEDGKSCTGLIFLESQKQGQTKFT